MPLKLILQKSWSAKLGWDDKLPAEAVRNFNQWYTEISSLRKIEIDRSITAGLLPSESISELHTLCDASQEAYAAVAYLRTTCTVTGQSRVQLLMARSRLAPIKRPIIPRMELLACVIGARLMNFIREALNWNNIRVYLWSDSTTALAWIKWNDEWGTFVGNRVREICALTRPEDWRHVPGIKNPADLPSRGCTPRDLLQCRWWVGPSWLYGSPREWPVEDIKDEEEVVLSERKRLSSKAKPDGGEITSVTAMLNQEDGDKLWYMTSSSYNKNIRVFAWMQRFIRNSRPGSVKCSSSVTVEEFCQSETVVLKLVQEAEFTDKNGSIHGLRVQKADDGLYHV